MMCHEVCVFFSCENLVLVVGCYSFRVTRTFWCVEDGWACLFIPLVSVSPNLGVKVGPMLDRLRRCHQPCVVCVFSQILCQP